MEPEGPPLQHVPVLPRVEPDGLNHQHIAEHSIAKQGLPLQPDDLHSQQVPDLPKAGHEGPHLMQVTVLTKAERGLPLQLDGIHLQQVPDLSKAEHGLTQLQELHDGLSQLQVPDSARLMDDEQETGTKERSERDNSTEKFIIPDSLQSERSSDVRQLQQETNLIT